MATTKIPTTLFNTSITVEEFLRDYWNKKPLLIKRAFSDAANLAQPDELAGLALEEDFETRIVYKDKKGKRKMLHGPFEEQELMEYSKEPFALICHNLNTLAPEFYRLEEAVGFIPKWEFDDVMGVYSNKDMSLGAHIDNYNVFILQGQGKRRWEIQENPTVAWRNDEEIKVLQEFNADYTWDLEPGDMVYIPPGVAHHGISVEESLSYSIGFKSLETVDALGEYMADLKQSDEPSTFFRNVSFNKESQSDVTDGLFNFVNKELNKLLAPEGQFQKWLLKKLSRPKFPIQPTGEKPLPSYKGLKLQRDVFLKYSLYEEPAEDSFYISINETAWKINAAQKELILPILDSNPFDFFFINQDQENEIKQILDELFEQGCIFISEDS